MPGTVIRFCDYQKRFTSTDACEPRDPADTAVIIVLPVVRSEPLDRRNTARGKGYGRG